MILLSYEGASDGIETSSGPVFVLLTSGSADDNPKSGILSALAPDVSRNEEPYSYAVATKLSGSFSGDAKADLPRAAWPMMVRFRDINDPKSVEKVDPASIGVTRIMLETTGDAVTTGIEGRLGLSFWQRWSQLHQAEMGQNGGVMDNPYFQSLAGKLTRNDFTTESAK